MSEVCAFRRRRGVQTSRNIIRPERSARRLFVLAFRLPDPITARGGYASIAKQILMENKLLHTKQITWFKQVEMAQVCNILWFCKQGSTSKTGS
jgi:hypothetical protein